MLRGLHLLESPVLDRPITTYPVDGDHAVIKPCFEPLASSRAGAACDAIQKDEEMDCHGAGASRNDGGGKTGRVWINVTQYFGDVPEIAWNFYIGGYQPAQKWLKDRKGRNLTIDDIRHYQRIIVALTETGRVMREIDTIDFLPK